MRPFEVRNVALRMRSRFYGAERLIQPARDCSKFSKTDMLLELTPHEPRA